MKISVEQCMALPRWLGSDQLRSRSEDNSTGNWGAQDQRMALKWVKSNIAAFHGVMNVVVSTQRMSPL